MEETEFQEIITESLTHRMADAMGFESLEKSLQIILTKLRNLHPLYLYNISPIFLLIYMYTGKIHRAQSRKEMRWALWVVRRHGVWVTARISITKTNNSFQERTIS